MAGARFAVRRVDQFLKDPAVGNAVAALALRAQRLKLSFKRLQRLALRLNALKMRAHQRVHLIAGYAGVAR